MDSLAVPAGPVDPAPPLPEVGTRIISRGRAWCEVGIVLALTTLPATWPEIHRRLVGIARDNSVGMNEALSWHMMYAVVWSAPVLLLMGRSPGGWSSFDLKRFRFFRDAALGTALFIAAKFLFRAEAALCRWVNLPLLGRAPGYPLHSAGAWIALVVATAMSSFAQELVFRAFLTRRLEQGLEMRTMAMLVSAVTFGAFHLYQGSTNMLLSATFGLLMGIFLRYSRNLWPCVIAHALYNVSVYMARAS